MELAENADMCMTPETIASFQEIMCHCAVAQSAGFRAGQI
jgi:hypothetical protein